jgi:hypothetical protein
MANLILNGSTSGSVTLSSPAVSGTTTLTLPTTSGTVITTGSTFAGTGPAFSVTMSANQSITSNVNTKLQFNTEDFDTNSCYNTSDYRFTPNVAGYYQINASVYLSTTVTFAQASVFKNGALFKRGFSSSTNGMGQVSTLIYLNGTTDYVECYGEATGTLPTVSNSSGLTWFNGSMVRAA